jgi:malate/lactate dehydrogenase
VSLSFFLLLLLFPFLFTKYDIPYDIHNNQIPTTANVTGHLPSSGAWPMRGNDGLKECLTGAKVVVIPAGVPRKP